MNKTGDVKFAVDTMLGSVARWLRILGYDTLYSNDVSDDELLKKASVEGRIIVTRDKDLAKKALKYNLSVLLLEDEEMYKKLAFISLMTGIKLEFDENTTRCPLCNTLLVKVGRDSIGDRVKPIIRMKYEKFWVCNTCGKVYWMGLHWPNIREILDEAKRVMRSGKPRV